MTLKFLKNKQWIGAVEIYEITTLKLYPNKEYIYFTILGKSYEDSKMYGDYEEILLDGESIK
jgi:hypothetical protein